MGNVPFTRLGVKGQSRGGGVVVAGPGSQVGVGEHGVFLPHCAEAFDGVHKLLVFHELRGRSRTKCRKGTV